MYALRSAAQEPRVKSFLVLSSIVTMGTMLRDDRPVSRHEWFETTEEVALSVDHKGYVYGAAVFALKRLSMSSLCEDARGKGGLGLRRGGEAWLCVHRDLPWCVSPRSSKR